MEQPLLVLLLPERLERFPLEQPVRDLLRADGAVAAFHPFQYYLAGALLARNTHAELWYGRPEAVELGAEFDAELAERAALTMSGEQLLAIAPLRMAELGIATGSSG